jgi:hypothetical protein
MLIAPQWFIAENGVIMSLVDVPTGFAFAYDGAPKGDVMIAKVVTHWTIKAKP